MVKHSRSCSKLYSRPSLDSCTQEWSVRGLCVCDCVRETAPLCLVSNAFLMMKTIEEIGGARNSSKRREKDLCF